MKKRVIIGPHAGGVGDNMLYSWIPENEHEKAKAEGYEVEVVVGVGGQNPAWRNSETYDLIWGKNPYFAGYTDETPTVGVHVIVGDFIGEAKRQRSPIAAVEYLHGFEPKHRLPKLYYQPNIRPEFANSVMISPTSISCPTPDYCIDEFVSEIARWHLFDARNVIVLKSKHDGQWGQKALAGNPEIQVRDIYEYVDLIASCGMFLTSESGGNSIAAAVRKPWTTHAICSMWTFNDKLWLYDGITYRAEPRIALGSTYHPYPPTNRPQNVWGEVAI